MFAFVAEADEAERQLLVPIVAEFDKIAEWFVHRAHIRKKPMEVAKESELVDHFQKFERIVLNLVHEFFRSAGDLLELLQEANARTH